MQKNIFTTTFSIYDVVFRVTFNYFDAFFPANYQMA